MEMRRRRVVITGCGTVSALGNSPEALYRALCENRSAVRYLSEYEAEFGKALPASPVVLEESLIRSVPRQQRRGMGDAALYAAIAAQGAYRMAGLAEVDLSDGRSGCAVSSTMGSSRSIYEAVVMLLDGRREEIPAMQFFRCASHSAALNLANLFGLTGMTLAPCAACASGLQSLATAYEMIAFGRQELMFAGGSDEVTPAVTGSFAQLFALADAPELPAEEVSRPFDAARTGLVCGAGAGILVLEEYEHARRRGAEIVAEILGCASNTGGVHVGQSDAASIARCIGAALDDAGCRADAIDYVAAHATSTQSGDREEAAALRGIFGAAVPVAGLKGHLGHTLGASGALELTALCEMFRRDRLLFTRNLKTVAPECGGLDHVTSPRPMRVRTLLKTAVAFGGINVAVVIRNLL